MFDPRLGFTTRELMLQSLGLYDDFKALCDMHGVVLNEVFSKGRDSQVAAARHDIMLYLREVMQWSYPRIGKFLDRDHTSVMHGVKAAKERREKRKNERKAQQRLG